MRTPVVCSIAAPASDLAAVGIKYTIRDSGGWSVCHFTGTERSTVESVLHRINNHNRLTAEVAALREALAECVTDTPEAACYNTGKKTRRLETINEIARAALAKGEKDSE